MAPGTLYPNFVLRFQSVVLGVASVGEKPDMACPFARGHSLVRAAYALATHTMHANTLAGALISNSAAVSDVASWLNPGCVLPLAADLGWLHNGMETRNKVARPRVDGAEMSQTRCSASEDECHCGPAIWLDQCRLRVHTMDT